MVGEKEIPFDQWAVGGGETSFGDGRRWCSSSKKVISWRPDCGEDYPTPNSGEIVVFYFLLLQWFRAPIFEFFRGVLDYYGKKNYHLNSNSILHILVFIHV